MPRTVIGRINASGKYERYRASTLADNDRLTEMLERQESPRCMTDSVFFAGVGTLADQFEGDEKMLETVVARARAKGYNPSYTDFYNSRLADDVGDPKAFIPATGGRHHVRQVLEERDWTCDGAVNRKRDFRDPPQEHKPHLAPDVAAACAPALLRKDSKLRNKPQELKEAVTDAFALK